MKKYLNLLSILFVLSLSFFLTSCSSEEGKYQTKEVNFYNKSEVVEGKNVPVADRKIKLRFYENTPNVPFIGVNEFYNEFYNTNLEVIQNGDVFKFVKDRSFVEVDTKNNILNIVDIDNLCSHPDFVESTSTIYLKNVEKKETSLMTKTINLNNYLIEAYKTNGDAYLPVTLIGNIMSGTSLFDIVYNEKDLYEFDYQGQLSNSVSRIEDYYGDSFKEPMLSNTTREKDLVELTYNLLCLTIDNFRGYTTQMQFIDNNVLSLGLNGTLEKYYPRMKQLLLSQDRKEYIAGITGLFLGLYDGGHTALLTKLQIEGMGDKKTADYYANSNDNSSIVMNSAGFNQAMKIYNNARLAQLKTSTFGITKEEAENYYYYDENNDIAYLGFNSFKVNYDGWDKYYKAIENNENGVIPSNDTYAFVRSKLYQALEDKPSALVLDLSTNGGGNSSALLGVLGLLNGGDAVISFNDVFNKFRKDDINKVDINLDGKYDEKDKAEADKFKELNIVILTSNFAFSCGNLLPSLLKELGFNIIGENSGGGSCAIMLGATADGLSYVHSSFKCLSDASGHNIDSGVEVDVSLVGEPIITDIPTGGTLSVTNYNNFFNVSFVKEVIANLVNQ